MCYRYTYDAWGNHRIYDGSTLIYDSATGVIAAGYENHIAILNPIRYRGYYYDTETRLYYLQSRYYDATLCRFLNRDNVNYLEPESIHGLNLYAYCNNNPVMFADPSGNEPKWLQVAAWIGLSVGVVLCIGAIVILGAGVGATTLVGAIAVGAAKGALVGAGIGSVVGAVGAGAWALIDDKSFGSNEFWSYVLYGGLLGLGIGSLIGAILGGHIGANGWYSAKAIEFTNAGSNEVVLGRSPGYVNVAKNKGATYFNTKDAIWNANKSMKGVGKKGMWRINKAFLKQQIKAGAHFTLVNQVSGYYYAKEVAYVMKYGIYTFL